MILRVFRFDAKDDYELYYKPYEIELCEGASIKDALDLAAAQDRYLPRYESDFWLKIDGRVVHTSEAAAGFVKDDELVLQPLSERLAKCDFVMDEREFRAVYEHYFAPLFGQSEWEEYKALEPLFYATPARDAQPLYMGDSAVIFAAKMMQKHPEKAAELKRVVFSEFGIAYAQDLQAFLHRGAGEFEQIKRELKAAR